LLRRVECLGLRAAEFLLPGNQLALDCLDGLLLRAEFGAERFKLLLRIGEALRDVDEFRARETNAGALR
jgi:hypothetical protein